MRADGADGHHGGARESSCSPTPASYPTKRPNAVREESDFTLSYYQSADAGRSPSPSQYHINYDCDMARTDSGSQTSPRSLLSSTSTSSTSASDYSSESTKESPATRINLHSVQPRAASPSATGARRRTSIPSQGGTDRRRLAIIQMDTPKPPPQKQYTEHTSWTSDSGGSPSNSLRSRRGLEGGLALVAPPDASPRSYTALTPPMSAPMSNPRPSLSALHPVSSSSNHTRSTSEAVGVSTKVFGHVPRKSSREVAIIGTTGFPGASASVPQQRSNTSPATEALKPPLFQMPQSRSPSPGTSEISDSSSSANRARRRKDALAPGVSPIKELKEASTPVRTPNIGESKHISDRVAGPIVINLFPESPSPSSRPSSQLSISQETTSSRTTLSSPITPSTAFTSPTSTTPSPYLYYQPGLHATAGPLPPPPMAVFNIDPKAPPPPRPPRHSPIRKKGDMEAMKQALQLPPHVAAALKTKSSSPSSGNNTVPSSPPKPSTPVPIVVPPPKDRDTSSKSSTPESVKLVPNPSHTREGAFPPSRLCSLDSEPVSTTPEYVTISLPRPDSMDDLVASVGHAIDDMGIMSSSDVPPPSVVEPPRRHEGRGGRQGLEIRRDENRINVSPSPSPERPPRGTPLPSPPRSEESAAHSWVDPDKTLTFSEETLPPLPAKNDAPHTDTKTFKNALNIKRFSSLPRTPSLMSLNRLSTGSKRSSRTPSPSVVHSVTRPRPPVRRTRSTCPSAMYFADVIVKKSALERSTGYANKINELYNYDCGLGDWVAETRHKALRPQSSAKRASVNASGKPRAPSTSSPSIAPRHISQSSTDSGVTFPRRADAYSATDLSARTAGDRSPPNAPPPLPYPALASAPRNGPSRASTIIATSSSSSTRSIVSPSSAAKSPGSFFASLGRKTSLKKEKGAPLTPPSPAKVLSKSPPRTEPTPRPVNIPIAPSVPGGPRAPPNRIQRSQTIIIAPQNSMNGGSPQRSSTTIARRPSLFGGRGSAPSTQNDAMSEADFSHQVDKLAALLPKADRNVLAVYLRRTGQDLLAIGQYLEDEKNGTLRYA
ncbi:hypothetical protein HYDPIDRAFT_35739 [Hydnomerulius pinastri MD-312]|nr:hypothetical protein HYDPIDRAFT_35739 [Hydnomerulius pinastri MD-312]